MGLRGTGKMLPEFGLLQLHTGQIQAALPRDFNSPSLGFASQRDCRRVLPSRVVVKRTADLSEPRKQRACS